jgi:hypothetical protein
MNNERRLQTALFNTRRYSNYAMASEVAMRQTYWTPVLLGDDERFWVPATNREAGLLIKAGYEVAA